MNFQDIKLIIWDLDETFWNGTISEESISPNPLNIKFVKNTSDMGIVNSICSKNDFSVVKQQLTDIGMWDYFVFPSVDWTSKGKRIKNIVDTMKLRYVNVLFVDDNIQNLEEAKHFCPGIMTILPEGLYELYEIADKAERTDSEHKRLQQYHLLEKKEAVRGEFGTNEEFLMSCNIRVSVKYDCENHSDRIYDLVMRSNQLNYTKVRPSKEELENLFHDNAYRCGYVSVCDKFGDYGIVGFFALHHNYALHFVFSCRTLGMQVEQYVYMMLGCPKITISGDVVSNLNSEFTPPWINQEGHVVEDLCRKTFNSGKILIKGPCDMSQMYAFLNCCENLTTEFSYTNERGILTEGHNHTSQIVTALYASSDEREKILHSTSFFDSGMLSSSLQSEKFDFVVLSMLTDGNLGTYRHKETGYDIALCEKYYDLTDDQNKDNYIYGKIFTSGIDFREKDLLEFRNQFDCVKDISWHKTVENLERISSFIGVETKLILLLGSEREFTKKCPPSFENRHIEHAEMNRAISEWAQGKQNVILIHYDKYIHSQSDFIDTINHFSKRVYYDLAADLVDIFRENHKSDVKLKNKYTLYLSQLVQKLRILKRKLFNRKSNKK